MDSVMGLAMPRVMDLVTPQVMEQAMDCRSELDSDSELELDSAVLDLAPAWEQSQSVLRVQVPALSEVVQCVVLNAEFSYSASQDQSHQREMDPLQQGSQLQPRLELA
jgi:hypothetical protein